MSCGITAARQCVLAAPISPITLSSDERGGVDAQEGLSRCATKAAPRLQPVAEAATDGVDPVGVPDQEGPPQEGSGIGGTDAGPAPAGDGDPIEGSEEARKPEKLRDPCAPTRAQWDEHQATHLPFRIWCPHCVAGRLGNPPHHRAAGPGPEVPEVHLDYAFCRRQDEDQTATILVMKHRQSRAVRCWVVPQKGTLETVAADIAAQGIRELGNNGHGHHQDGQ